MKEQIARTEKLRDDLIADVKRKASDRSRPTKRVPARWIRCKARLCFSLQSQLQANQLEMANREPAISALMGRINDYQARLNEEPAVEQQLADLTRGYDQSKANYDDLLKKENDSSMATDMEQMQQGERFTMLDPPELTDETRFSQPP